MMNMTTNNVFNTMFNNILMQENTGDNAGGGSSNDAKPEVKTTKVDNIVFNVDDINEIDTVIKHASWIDHTKSNDYDEETDAPWSIRLTLADDAAWRWDYDNDVFHTHTKVIFLNMFEFKNFLLQYELFNKIELEDGTKVIDDILVNGNVTHLEGMKFHAIQVKFHKGSKNNVAPFTGRMVPKPFNVDVHDLVKTYPRDMFLDVNNCDHMTTIGQFIEMYPKFKVARVVNHMVGIGAIDDSRATREAIVETYDAPEPEVAPQMNNMNPQMMMQMMMQMMNMMNGQK